MEGVKALHTFWRIVVNSQVDSIIAGVVADLSEEDRQGIIQGMLESLIATVYEGSFKTGMARTQADRAITVGVLLTVFQRCLNSKGTQAYMAGIDAFKKSLAMQCGEDANIVVH